MQGRILSILVTGGAGGLGRKICEYFHNCGHKIFVFDKVSKNEIDPAFLLLLSGYFQCDLSNLMELIECFNILMEKTQQVDVLINNVSVRQFKYLDDFQLSEIEKNIHVDFICPVILSRLCLSKMKKNNFGRIINISSISALQGYRTGSLYCSSKHALITFTESLSSELTHLNGAITINTICPDSFSKVNEMVLINHRSTINLILANINRLINSSKNGRIISIFTYQNRLLEIIRYMKRAIQILIN